MNFHTREDVQDIFSEFRLISLEEEEKDGITALGESKHWHVFHIIAQKL